MLYALIPTIVHLILDHIRGKKGTIVHWQSDIAVFVSTILTGVLTTKSFREFAQFATLALCVHFGFFDWLRNLTEGLKMFYHGDPKNPKQALTDQFWQMMPPWDEIFLRLLAVGTGVSVYFMDQWGLVI